MAESDLVQKAWEYVRRDARSLGPPLGRGVQGNIFVVKLQSSLFDTAIKVHDRADAYRRECDVYLRLREHDVTLIGGCHVPILLAHDDGLLILEMTIVTRPFVLDFGGAYLDDPPEFSDDVLVEWEREKREQYGDRWPDVRAILRELERLGVFMIDVHPGNISFGVG